MPRLLRFMMQKHGARSYILSSMKAGRRSTPRHQSGYWMASILMTSAPRSARMRVHKGPAHPIEKSITRTPSNGGRPALMQADEGEGRRLRTFAIACCSPGTGTLPPRRGGVNVKRCIEPAVRPSSSSRSTGTIAPRSVLSPSWRRSDIWGTGTIGILRLRPSVNHCCAVRVFSLGRNCCSICSMSRRRSLPRSRAGFSPNSERPSISQNALH